MHIPFVLVILGNNYQVSSVQEHRTNPRFRPGSSVCISAWFARPSIIRAHLLTQCHSRTPTCHPKPDQITPPPLCLCLCYSISKAPPSLLPPLLTHFKAKPELPLLHQLRAQWRRAFVTFILLILKHLLSQVTLSSFGVCFLYSGVGIFWKTRNALGFPCKGSIVYSVLI